MRSMDSRRYLGGRPLGTAVTIDQSTFSPAGELMAKRMNGRRTNERTMDERSIQVASRSVYGCDAD